MLAEMQLGAGRSILQLVGSDLIRDVAHVRFFESIQLRTRL